MLKQRPFPCHSERSEESRHSALFRALRMTKMEPNQPPKSFPSRNLPGVPQIR